MDEANPQVMNEDNQTPTLSSITSQSQPVVEDVYVVFLTVITTVDIDLT